MAGIFISYRQADAKAWAISLRDDLAKVFGADQIFLDKDTLRAGNWREQIQAALYRCTVMLVVIGPRWLTIADEQNRPYIQLDDDVHRQEIALALTRAELTVIPVLVEEAPIPRMEQLPTDLHKLCELQVRKIGDTRARREADLKVLVGDIETVGGIKPHHQPSNQARPLSLNLLARRGGVKHYLTTLGSTFALTLFVAMYAYLSNNPLNHGELFFLLLAFFALVIAVRGLWAKFLDARRRRK
jgi:hypothetical protein